MISVHRFAVLGPTEGSVVRHRPNVQQVPPFPRCNAAGVHTSITTGQRRSANYKPNIWTYDAIQSLPPASNVDLMRLQAEVLIDGVRHLLEDTTAVEKAAKLELVDWVEKLGLGNLFNKEIDEALHTIASNDNDNEITIQKNKRLVALRFRLLRQRGYKVSPDGLDEYLGNKTCMLGKNMHKDEKDIMELLEASHLGLDGERVLDAAKAFMVGLPSHWRVQWFDVKKNIETYQKGRNDRQNSALLELAKLNFKMVQSTHQTNFKNMSRWWKNLGLNESLSFTRDRLAESFLWAVGVACEPECGHLREWLTKTINLILVIDDVYDVFGSFDELQIFTDAVVAWDPSIVEQLPECMKICFHALYNTTTEVANEMQEESGDNVLPHLKRAWADFCKAMLVEASWDNIGYTPSLEVYLNNGWISSSGPLLCVHIFLSARTLYEAIKAEPIDTLMNQTQELVLSVSLIIRLCNDLATSAAEIKRGDAPSSVVCYMREANVSEQEAREHIKGVIVASWKRINEQCINMQQGRPELKPLVRMGTNVARMAHCMYHHGDGFGDQDPETREHIASLLIHPLSL